MSDKQVEQILHSVEKDAKTFRSSLDHALDQSRLDSTGREDDVNARVRDFEEATKQLHDRFDNRQSAGSDVQNVLDRASRIDEFMRRNPLDRRAQSDWSRMRGNLDRLASAYGVSWRWQQAYLPAETQSRPYRINDREVERLSNALIRRLRLFDKVSIARSIAAVWTAHRAKMISTSLSRSLTMRQSSCGTGSTAAPLWPRMLNQCSPVPRA